MRWEVIETKETRRSDQAGREQESRRIVDAIPPTAVVILLDLKGREWTSFDLAAMIQRLENDGAKEVAIIVGGPEGVGQIVSERAKVRWRLSRLTLTHEMARVIVAEQVYRAYAINRGLPYQK